MKRALTLATMILGMMALLVACGNSGSGDPVKDLNGSWSIDFEKIFAEMPEFKDMPAEQKEAAKQMMAPMKELKLTFDTDKKTITSAMGASGETTTEFTVKSQEGGVITITIDGQDGTIKFIDKDTISMSAPNMPGGQQLTLNRVK